MIVDLPDTTVSKISRALVNVREEGGAVALGRVLTLVILTREGALEEVIEAANDASREHPMRVIVLMIDGADADSRLDAQIRVGGDAGASEVVTLRAFGEAGSSNLESLVTGLLLPDAPVVVWWPNKTPDSPSTTSIGRIAQRRITDAATKSRPVGVGRRARREPRSRRHRPGLDAPHALARAAGRRARPAAVRSRDRRRGARCRQLAVHGAARGVAAPHARRAGRLALPRPRRVDGRHQVGAARPAPSGEVLLERSSPAVACLTQPGQPEHDLVLARRTLRECLAEELRRLDPDVLYGRVITEGWELLEPATQETHG